MEVVFKALADQTRLRILGLLLAGETCVCDIHGSLRVPQPTASRHLGYLRRAGLVEARRQGLWIYYRLAQPADAVLRALVDCATHCLTHVDSVEADRGRLAREHANPLSLLSIGGAAFSCCGPSRRTCGDA